jgi:hypothetical protein
MRELVYLSGITVAVLATAPAAFGMGSGPRASVAPVILSVAADLKHGTLVITGRDLGTGSPTVRLADRILEVESVSGNTIVAKLPAGLQPATYRLTVTTHDGLRIVRSDDFHATLQ